MAEDENIYYIQKQDDNEHISLDTTDCVWQDAYTEVVAYEENVEDTNSLNITYVTEGNESSNENYETAVEDNSQYYSVIETNETLDNDQTLQSIESHSELELNENFKNNLTVIQYPTENVDLTIKNELVSSKIENVDNTVVEDDDQVILYKIEDSNELFAVQIARDADGNIQKYQYKVRQNEDGQLEAVPGTIQIQPEGTEQLICEESVINKDLTVSQNIEETENENYQSMYNENSVSDIIKNEIAEEIMNENVNDTNSIQTEETVYETNDQYNEIEVENQYQDDEDEVVEKLDQENNHIEYLKQDEAEVLQHTGGETYYEEIEGEEEEFENIEYLQDDDDEEETIQYEQLDENYIQEPTEQIFPDGTSEGSTTYIKQYPESSQIDVLSNVLMESNTNINTLRNNSTEHQHHSPPNTTNTPKQILNKLSDITFGNESIELKRVNSGTASKQANKLTFLIVTHPEEKQNLPKNLVNNKKFRSILRPTIHQQSSLQKTNYSPVFKVNCKQVKHKVEVPISKTIINNSVINITTTSNKGPRQPRKQVITPVDRVGSEIIIQAPEEKDLPLETYDLDAFSDEEYSPKMKSKMKKLYQTKKRGKKPMKSMDIVIMDSNSKSVVEVGDMENNDYEDTTVKINSSKRKDKNEKPVKEIEIKKVEKPKFDKILPTRKRGRPGRPKLSEKNKLNIIEKEVISSGSIKGGQSGRPKFIRTTRKISNGKQKIDSKENDEKSIRTVKNEIHEKANEEVVEVELTTPKRRGRPPKKYTPDDSETRKRKSSSDDNVKNNDVSDKYFGFCSDSEIEEREISDKPPDSKKQKTDLVNNKENDVAVDEKKDIVDDLMSEMQDIHGVSDEEHIKIDEVIVENEKTETETLLSILETSPNEKLEKEDVLTRALKSANIITPSDPEDVTLVDDAKQKCELKTNPDTFLLTDNESINKNNEIESKKIPVENELINKNKNNKIDMVAVESTRKPIYKCAKCAKTFVKYISLKTHLQEHNLQKKGKFNCNKCSRIFTLESAFKFHEKTTHLISENNLTKSSENNFFKCIHCSKSFKTLLQLKTHKISQHKTFKCDKCSEIFDTRSQHLNHIRNHTQTASKEDESNAKSRTLRRSTQEKREFSEIIQTISKIDKSKRKTVAVMNAASENTSDGVNNPDMHRCNVCMKTFRQLAHLVMHREVHNKPTCSNCGQVFPFKHVLSEHMRRYCLKSPLSTKKSTHSLKRNLVNRETILKRQSLNVNNSTYDCEKCKKAFKNKMFYNNHMKMYHMLKSPSKRLSNSVQRSKTPVKKIKSSITDNLNHIKIEKQVNINNTVSAAAISERRQSDRKQVPTKKIMPIRCEMCDLSFTTYTGLFRHTLSHPDIKEKCEHCDAGFETKIQLLKHQQTHINVECQVCNKNFKTVNEFNKHNNECDGGKKTNDQSEDDNKSVLLTVKKPTNIRKKILAHGGIPLSLKLKNKLLKRKL